MSTPAPTPPRHGVIGPVLFGGSRARQVELPSYAAFFGFVAPPFDLTLDPRFVFLGASHARARAEILDGLQRREGLIVLTGASGTGKTTLCRWTLQSVPGPTFASIVVDPLVTPHELLVQVLTDFGVISAEFAGGESVSHIGCHELTLVLRRFLDSLVPSGARALIVIDDAHQVSTAVLAQLRALSNLETATAKQLQIILIGQPSLESTLDTPELDSLRQRVSRQCRLEALTFEEIPAFIDHRVTVALGRAPARVPDGSTAAAAVDDVASPATTGTEESGDGLEARQPAVTFSRPAVTVLAQLSEGVPRTLTRLCDRALDVAAAHRARRVLPEHVFQAAGRVNVPVRFVDRIRIGRSTVLLAVAVSMAAAFWGLWISGRPRPLPPTGRTPVAASQSVPPVEAPVAAGATAAAGNRTMTPPTTLRDAPSPSAAIGPLTAALADAESFVLLVGSFKNVDGASVVRQQLVDKGLPAFVRDDGAWHVVLVGPFASRPEADAVLGQLDHAAFVGARVVKAN